VNQDNLSAEGNRILVVVDEPVTRRMRRQVLENARYQVSEAEDGEHGIELCLAELRMLLANGGIEAFLISAEVTPEAGARPKAMFGVVQDVTERRETEALSVLQLGNPVALCSSGGIIAFYTQRVRDGLADARDAVAIPGKHRRDDATLERTYGP